MTPNFRALAEKIVEESYVQSFLPAVAKVFDYHKCTRDIETALKQVYEQRPKSEIEWPSLEELLQTMEYASPHWKCGARQAYTYLRANTKIKEASDE